MKSYSQSQEDKFVLNYFASRKGTLLEIGSNDGLTFSNSKLLIEHGWHAHLIEPGSINTDLTHLHKDNHNVEVHCFGLGTECGTAVLHESGAHVPGGNDHGLVSSLIPEETERWRKSGVGFIENTVQILDFATFWSYVGEVKFDFISIDCEGLDWVILQQIDLSKVGCSCLCIEWNGDSKLRNLFADYCGKFGLKLAHFNRENLIFVKNI